MKKLLFLALVMSITSQAMEQKFVTNIDKDAPLQTYIQVAFEENPKSFDISYSDTNSFQPGELVVIKRPYHNYIDEITSTFVFKNRQTYKTKLGAMDTAERIGKINNLQEVKARAESRKLENKKK